QGFVLQGLGVVQWVSQSVYGYDAQGHMVSQTETQAPLAIAPNLLGFRRLNQTFYVYDVAGRLGRQLRNGKPTFYHYDATNQVTTEGNASDMLDWQYDNNAAGTGNRTQETLRKNGVPAVVTSQIGVGNRLKSSGMWNYQYDDAGNLVGKRWLVWVPVRGG